MDCGSKPQKQIPQKVVIFLKCIILFTETILIVSSKLVLIIIKLFKGALVGTHS